MSYSLLSVASINAAPQISRMAVHFQRTRSKQSRTPVRLKECLRFANKPRQQAITSTGVLSDRIQHSKQCTVP